MKELDIIDEVHRKQLEIELSSQARYYYTKALYSSWLTRWYWQNKGKKSCRLLWKVIEWIPPKRLTDEIKRIKEETQSMTEETAQSLLSHIERFQSLYNPEQ